jgi:protease-4
MQTILKMIMATIMLLMIGCGRPEIKLFPDASEPLREFTLEGTESGKVLLIPVRGIVSDVPEEGTFVSRPSMVEEIVSQLRLAENDEEVKAVLLKIDSPGGSATASDLLYHEIEAFKTRTQAKIVVVMMDLATSGAYYISLPADHIVAHPTTVTGSIGVIFMRPAVGGLMEKIGLEVEVNKSGKNKDMGSPFRKPTEEEEKMFDSLTHDLGARFLDLVAKNRRLDEDTLKEVATARIYLAQEALQIGLVDEIGYLSDAISRAKSLSGLSQECKVIVYRRTEYPDDNMYNTATMQDAVGRFSLVDLQLPHAMASLSPGFYYLWLPVSGY